MMFTRSAHRRPTHRLSWLKGQLASAMLWNGLAAMCAHGLPVLGMLIAARILGREPFGQLGIVYQTIMTLQVFAVLGLGITATTFIARWLPREPDRVPRVMALCYAFTALTGGLFALGFIVGADPIAVHVLAAPALADQLRLGGVLALLSALAAVQSGMLVGFKAFRDMATANFLGGIASAALLAAGAYRAGVDGALVGLGVALALRMLLNYLLIRRAMARHGLRMRWSLPRAELPLLWRFSLPSVLTMALWSLGSWIASALLVRQPDGMAEMGLLAAANQWFSALMFVPGVLTQVLLPTYSERLAGDRPAEAGNLALRSALILTLCIVPVGQQRPPFWRHNHWSRQTLFSIYHMNEANLRSYVDAIHEAPARYAQGYPSSLHLVGRAMLDAGRPLPPGRLVAVFTSSESLLAFQRETIEKAFGAPVRDRYGVSELAVSMTACPRDRLHVDMEFCIVEVEPLEETAEYVRGPLLVTGLATEATPFLRYRVGDVATRLKRPCECGRPGDVFLGVDGRIEDYVATPDGRLVGRLDHIFKAELDVAEAQVLQEDPAAIEVPVVPRASWGPAAERSLRKEIRSRLGSEIGVTIRLVDAIPREPNGKLRAVKSRVGMLPS